MVENVLQNSVPQEVAAADSAVKYDNILTQDLIRKVTYTIEKQQPGNNWEGKLLLFSGY